ncbi:MAG: GAF domain-containing protein, partial [Paracoccaceae bacterium]|nr:GAF domain-containing protein [Paracoccaceae bacterium]
WNGTGRLLGVFDLDSDTAAAFTAEDARALTVILARVFRAAD